MFGFRLLHRCLLNTEVTMPMWSYSFRCNLGTGSFQTLLAACFSGVKAWEEIEIIKVHICIFSGKWQQGPRQRFFFFILCRNCHRLHSCRLSLSWWKSPNDGFSHECKGQRGCHWSLSLLLSHMLNCKMLLTSYGLKNTFKGFTDSFCKQDLTLIVLKGAVLLIWSISLTRTYLNVKKTFMLKLKCHLLLLSVHLLQWFSASLPSSTPLWTTLLKFMMGRLSIPVFSAPCLVHIQVRIHKISFWCNLEGSSCLYFNCYKTFKSVWAHEDWTLASEEEE